MEGRIFCWVENKQLFLSQSVKYFWFSFRSHLVEIGWLLCFINLINFKMAVLGGVKESILHDLCTWWISKPVNLKQFYKYDYFLLMNDKWELFPYFKNLDS